MFREILLTNPNLKLTYDFCAATKTVLNQCWNFQPLLKTTNGAKGKDEKHLATTIRENGVIAVRQDERCMTYLTHINQLLQSQSAKKPLWKHSPGIRATINNFFGSVGLPAVQWMNGYESKSQRCKCIVCEYCRGASREWRLSYFMLYQSCSNADHRFSKPVFDNMVLRGVFIAVFGNVTDTVDHYIRQCEEHGLENVGDLLQELHDPKCELKFVGKKHPRRLRINLEHKVQCHVANIIGRTRDHRKLPDRLDPFVDFLPEAFGRRIRNYMAREDPDKTEKDALLADLRRNPMARMPGQQPPAGTDLRIFTKSDLLSRSPLLKRT